MNRAELTQAIAAAICLGLWSSWVTGFAFGVDNNVFHIPFVLRYAQLPAYSNDAFYQTLHNFVSAFWWLFRLFAAKQHLVAEFLAVFVVSRAATFLAFLVLLRTLGLSVGEQLCAAAILAASSILIGGSYVGAHGLFVDSLTHSEVTHPFVLLAFAFALVGRWTLAAALAAVVFDLNAFIGMWTVTAIGFLALSTSPRISVRDVVNAAAAFISISIPVLLWIRSAGAWSDAVDFSFREYTREYYPNHVLIEAATPLSVVSLVGFWCTTLLAVTSPAMIRWRRLLIGLMLIFLAGVPLPYLLDSRTIVNLHLLRVDGLIQLLGAVILAAFVVRTIVEPRSTRAELMVAVSTLVGLAAGSLVSVSVMWVALLRHDQRLIGRRTALALYVIALALWLRSGPIQAGPDVAPIVGTTLFCAALLGLVEVERLAGSKRSVAIAYSLCVTALILVFRHRLGVGGFVSLELPLGLVLFMIRSEPSTSLPPLAVEARRSPVVAKFGVLALILFGPPMLAAQAVAALDRGARLANMDPVERDWRGLLAWCQDPANHGEIQTPVLVPIKVFDSRRRPNFQLQTELSVWVDWKQGAAVMWAPAFYRTWGLRYKQVLALHTSKEYFDYAYANGIPTMVVEQDGGSLGSCPEGSSTMFVNEHFALCSVSALGRKEGVSVRDPAHHSV